MHGRSKTAFAAAAVGLGALAAVGAATVAAAAADPKPGRWNWTEGTIWYVPPNGFPAIVSSPDTNEVLEVYDQTVYSIDRYWKGYIWGYQRVQFWSKSDQMPVTPDSDPTCARMVGSITPEGTLNVSFTPLDGGTRTTGVGFMQKFDKAWTMEMQMTTGSDDLQISHWAYMEYCDIDKKCPLPGIKGSAQSFLQACRDLDAAASKK
jgi:hypothetical protein